jgi:hypothetical protein
VNGLIQQIKISCIHKIPHKDYWHRLKYLGGRTTDGTWWMLSHQKVIDYIINNEYSFYYTYRNHEINIIVALNPDKCRYLTAEPKWRSSFDLLSLPECPYFWNK